MKKLDAIILAGGPGTRLKKVINDLPKPLAPINNRPFLDILLNYLNKWDCVKKVILAVGYMADKIIEEYMDRQEYNFEILFSKEKELLGTAGAIKKALQYTETASILALNGDSYVDVNINDLIKIHKKNNTDMTMVLRKVEGADRYGRVKLDSNNRIIYFEEKSPVSSKGYINAGIYLFKKRLFDDVKDNKVISLEKELLPIFLEKGVYGYISKGKFIDIGVPETYKIAGKYLKEVC